MQRLMARCNDCKGWVQPHALYVDEKHNLVVVGMCLDCLCKVHCPIAIADLYKMSLELTQSVTADDVSKMVGKEIDKIRDEAGKPVRPPLKKDWTAEDKKFLKIARIKEE